MSNIKDNDKIIDSIINGEKLPDLIQSYKLIKGYIDSGFLKGLYTSDDSALIIRSLDTLRNHINNYNENKKT